MQGNHTGLPTHVATYTMYINAAAAEKILKTHSWSRQRPIDRKHVEYLFQAMLRQEVRNLELTYGQLPDGEKFLVDGYHRLTAMTRLSYPMPALIKTYQVKDEDDLARLYMTLDRPKVRTANVMVRASGIEAQTDMNATAIGHTGAAAMFVESGFAPNFRVEKSLILRTEITEAWLKEGELFHRWLIGSTNEVRGMLVKQPVMSIALATIRYSPEKSYDFWRGAAMEDKLEREDPRAKLLSWMRANPRISALGGFRYAHYIAACWNAWMEQRSMQIVKPQDGPIKLLGTPFDGKDR